MAHRKKNYTSQAKHQVFLSYSGAQKGFVEQLCVDLERYDRHPFFDKHWDCLPIGKDFPRLIFEAIEECEVGVVVLSEEFFTSKWPMLELVAMANFKERKSSFTIMPVFLGISLSQCRDVDNHKRWLSLWHTWVESDSRIDVEDLANVLQFFGRTNALKYNFELGEVKFREEIVEAICKLVPPRTLFEDSHIQGRSRLCKVIHERIKQSKLSSLYGVHVVGLYGISGIGKTTLCKAMCNDVFEEFHGKVAHMEFGSQSEEDLLKELLLRLTDTNLDYLGAMNVDKYGYLLMRKMMNVKVFLTIDNVSSATSKPASALLRANYGPGSVVLVIARSLHELMSLRIDASECMEMPELEMEEARSLFLYHAACVPPSYSSNKDDLDLISSCIQQCHFYKGDGISYHYHPLALQVLGEQLGCVGYVPAQWWLLLHELDFLNPFGEPQHPVFFTLRRSFDALTPQDQLLFMDAALYAPYNHSFVLDSTFQWNIFEWLAMVHGIPANSVIEQLKNLKRKSLLENLGDGLGKVGMHDLWREFARLETKAGEFEKRRWIFEWDEYNALEEASVANGGCLVNVRRMFFLDKGFMKLEDVSFICFPSVTVLKLSTNFASVQELDLRGFKCLKSLELECSSDYAIRSKTLISVVGLGSLLKLGFLRWLNIPSDAPCIDEIGLLTNLQVLDLYGCGRLPDLSRLILLRVACFRHNDSITTIAGFCSNHINLQFLDLSWCVNLQSCLGVGDLVALQELCLVCCFKLKEVPNLQKLKQLRKLDVSECRLLQGLPGLGDLVNLLELHAHRCRSLAELPDVCNLRNLRILDLRSCELIKSLPGLNELVCLQSLKLSGCKNLTQLPDMQKLTNLQTLECDPYHPLQSAAGLSNSISLLRRSSDISCSASDFPEDDFPNQLDDETIEAEVEMLGILPPYSNISAPDISDAWPTIELAKTGNEQPCQPISPRHDMLLGSSDGALKFTMSDLNIITGNFSESRTIGQGSSGSIYRGQLKDGTTVAVKRIKKNDKNVLEIEDAKDFQTEADILSKEKHLNLMRLVGFLEDENEQIVVTEYVTNGNLRQHLDGVPYGVILDMSKRCRISLDVVAALKHLHYQTKDDLDIIHRDIKSSDILITNDFRAKVSGFGLSRRSPFGDVGASSGITQAKGTLECMAHEHLTTHHLKEKNDVYSFGELLVEIFTGKRLVESSLPSDECFTPRWVLKQCAEGRLMDIIDPQITPTTFNLKILEQIFMLAASCLALEKSSRPTVEDVFRALSFIVGHYFGDLKQQSISKGDIYEVQKEQKWDLEVCIEPNLQTLGLEESEALKGQEPTKHMGDKVDSSNPSFMLAKPHGSLFVEGFESDKVQTSIQLGTQLEVDSKQATSQALELPITKQDHTSPLIIDIMPDVFQLKSDETYFEMLQEEIAKLGYISRLLSQDDDFEQNLTNIGKTSFFLHFNEKDNVFEFYFKNYQGMASIVGVGLECAKVVLEDGWRVTIQEISKPNWDDAWKNFDSSSSTMKVTISEPLEEGIKNVEASQEPLASIPRGQCLLLDLAQYFILKMAISSFLPRTSMMHANTHSGTSSSSSNQDIASSSSSSDQKPPGFLQAIKSIFSSREAFNLLKTKNGDGTPMAPPSGDAVKIDTTVHLKFLSGGCLYDGNSLLDATISDDEELKTLTSQLDNTIYLEMMIKFLNEDRKEIQVIVGPISFQFRVESEVNYKTTRRFGWYHKLLDVSFGPVNVCDSEIGPNHSALDIVKVKKTETIESSNATTCGTSNKMNGGVKGKVPHLFTLFCGGSSERSTSTCVSGNVGCTIEKDVEETRGGFAIFPKQNRPSSTLEYTYRAPDYMHELDHGKLPCEDYRKSDLNLLPICRPQDVKFEGTWYPKDLEYNPQVLVEYSLSTSRVVHMSSKEISRKVVKKSWIKRCGHPKIQKESNEPLKYTQKYARSFFLNHAMTHLSGKKFRVEEFLHQRPVNQVEPETYLRDCSCHSPQWRANPLVGLNSELDYQP